MQNSILKYTSTGNEGIAIFSLETLEYVYYPITTGVWNYYAPRENRILDIYIGKDPEIIHIIGHFGLGTYHTESKIFNSIPYDYLDEYDTSLEDITKGEQPTFTAIIPYDNKLYLSSWAFGICSFDLSNGEWKTYYFEPVNKADEKLKNDNVITDFQRVDSLIIYSVNRDTGNQVAFFNLKKNRFTKDLIAFPKLRKQANFAIHIDNSGYIWTAQNDVICKTPFLTSQNTNSKSVCIYQINDQPSIHAFLDKKILMDADQDSLTLKFGPTSNSQSSEFIYQYNFSSRGNIWIDNEQSNKLVLTNIPPRNHSVQIRAKSNQQKSWLYSEHLAITKKPHYTDTRVFKWTVFILSTLFIGLISGTSFLFQRKRNSLKLEYKKRLLESEMSALRAQMNPHFLFNSLNSINSYILQEDSETASRYLTKFSRLMRQILNNSQEDLVSLDQEIDTLSLYLETHLSKTFLRSYEYSLNPRI